MRLRVLRCEEIIKERREESFKEKRAASVALVEGPKWRNNNILRATKIQEGMFPLTWMEIMSRIMGLFLFLLFFSKKKITLQIYIVYIILVGAHLLHCDELPLTLGRCIMSCMDLKLIKSIFKYLKENSSLTYNNFYSFVKE